MVTLIASILVFLSMILIHELGHFLVAIKSGIQVNEFSIGMGPKIFQKKRNDILYSLRALPIGGYVAIEGEDEDSDNPKAFNNAKASRRLAVIIAGAIMNFILGFIILVGLNSVNYNQFIVTDFLDNSPAKKSGMEIGDIIYKIDGNIVYSGRDFDKYISKDEVVITILRDNESKDIKVTPKKDDGKYLIGIARGSELVKDFSITRGFKVGADDFIYYATLILKTFGDLVTGNLSFSALSGPVGVVKIIGESARVGMIPLLSFMAFMTINLGVFNMMPFPALDGGRAILIIIEIITGKKLPSKIEGNLNYIGFLLLILLIIVVSFKDIITLF